MSTRSTRAQRAALLARDARNRALRTFLQGLAIDVAVAVAAFVITVTSSPDAWQGWAAVGLSLSRTLAQTAASYVMRRFVDASAIPTPLPPNPPGEPDDDVDPDAGHVDAVFVIVGTCVVALGLVLGTLLLRTFA